jgi:hypothetical protein
MVYKCCVPNCRGNYTSDGPKVRCFSFPKDEENRRKWVNAIHRKNFSPTPYTKVCELHFTEGDFNIYSEAVDEKTGNVIRVKLSNPTLKSTAIPTVFPNSPSYLTTKNFVRENLDDRRTRKNNDSLRAAINESLVSKREYDAKKTFSNLDECLKCLNSELQVDEFSVIIKNNECLVLASIDLCSAPTISLSAVLNKDLQISLYSGQLQVTKLNNVSYPKTVNNINDLETILKDLKTLKTEKKTLLQCIIDNLKNVVTEDDEIKKTLNFMSQQLELISCSYEKIRYSCDVSVFACILFSISSHAYNFLRSSGYIKLPHPRTVRKMCSNYSTSPAIEQSTDNFLSFIRKKFQYLNTSDHVVTLMVDEVYLKPFFDYKGGNILGVANDIDQAATTAHVFMIQSLLSDFKEVVHILPVKSITAQQLYIFIEKCVVTLQSIGFRVICVVTDNNCINRKAMSYFCTPPQLKIVYCHPSDKSMPLFYVIDPVHIFKCIRNNWVNQKDDSQTLVYPAIEDEFSERPIQLQPASFSALKQLHSVEGKELVKYSHGLNLKSLYPNNLEKQNVKLVMNVFNEFVIEGLLSVGEKHSINNYKTTAEFIKIICDWWKVVNVKTKYKGIRTRDNLQEPITDESKTNYMYLKKVLFWLDNWSDCKSSNNTLSRETHLAFSHTTHAVIEIANYCLAELNFKYFLPGKIQTDALEARFGKYRTMAGSQYLITLRQIFEVESKIRMQNLISLTLESSSFGKVNVNFDENIDTSSFNYTDTNCEDSFPIINFIYDFSEDSYSEIENVLPIISYISGYCAKSTTLKINCTDCRSFLVLDKDLPVTQCEQFSFIRKLDRGGLKYPSSDVVNVVVCTYNVVKQLLSKEYENKFLHCSDQRKVVFSLTYRIVKETCFFLNNLFDNCKHSHKDLHLRNIITTSTNILLSNYVKMKNEFIQTNRSKKRKITTLNN